MALYFLQSHQLSNIPPKQRLNDNHLNKIIQCIEPKELFSEKCCKWKVKENVSKDLYVNMSIYGRHQCLHRLLYMNFVNPQLKKGQYLTRTCNNSLCLTIRHLKVKQTRKCKIEKSPFPKLVNFKVEFD